MGSIAASARPNKGSLRRYRSARWQLSALALIGVVGTPIACANSPESAETEQVSSVTFQTPTTPATVTSADSPLLTGNVLPTNDQGVAAAQATPAELAPRDLPTIDTLPPPTDDQFRSTIDVLSGAPLERSTWHDECPVDASDLSYVTVSFWGFDGRYHQGELIVASEHANDIVSVFEKLHAAKYPIEQMTIVTDEDLASDPTGITNNSASFVCRGVTGGQGFSQHAHGLAIDINPFHNPYIRDGRVIPELASAYTDRELNEQAIITTESVVYKAFTEIGWFWGGEWNSLKDYQHFSANNR